MIYVKTESGQAALLRHSLELTPRQRSAFIMFDGKRSVWDVLKATEGMGITEDDVSHMMAQGLLAVVVNTVQPLGAIPVNAAAAPAPVQSAPGAPGPVAQAHYSNAYPIATRSLQHWACAAFCSIWRSKPPLIWPSCSSWHPRSGTLSAPKNSGNSKMRFTTELRPSG